MKYKLIKVDMDYCADPLWVSEDSENLCFANSSLSEFEEVLSKGLLHGLEVYRSLWEKSNWTKYLSPTKMEVWPCDDITSNCLEEMRQALAERVKRELPDCRVFYPEDDLLDRYILIEVGAKPKLPAPPNTKYIYDHGDNK